MLKIQELQKINPKTGRFGRLSADERANRSEARGASGKTYAGLGETNALLVET